jgi:alginate O-acetyltransferase complex protein AlgJ
MKRLLARLLVLCVPWALLVALDLSLPADAFTFRTWEAVAVSYRLYYLAGLGPLRMPMISALPGPFVPALNYNKVEEGDLGHHTIYAVRRPAVWTTDDFGFRIRPGITRPQVVIVGDSEVVGTGLSQEDTLAEVLLREYGISAYPFAPATLADFLADARLSASPPRYLILEGIERNVVEELRSVQLSATPPPRAIAATWLRSLEIALNRVQRLNMVAYFQTLINGRRAPLARRNVLFLRGEENPPSSAPDDVEAVVRTLDSYAEVLGKRGVQLAILIVPDKENTYADLLPNAPDRRLISLLRTALQGSRVTWLELERDFAAARRAGRDPHQLDDTHWSAYGVRLAARNIAAWIGAGAEGKNAKDSTSPTNPMFR